MDIEYAEKFVYGWTMWERGIDKGIAVAVELVETLLCRDEVTEPQLEVLVSLYNSLSQARRGHFGGR
jgi:hypothetical protein